MNDLPVCNSEVALLIVNIQTDQRCCHQCASIEPGLVLTLDDARFLYSCGIDPEIAGIEKFVRPMPRMRWLIETGKIRKLTVDEKLELQRLFLRVAVNDVRVLKSE